MPTATPSLRNEHRRAPCAPSCVEPIVNDRRAQAALLEQPVIAEHARATPLDHDLRRLVPAATATSMRGRRRRRPTTRRSGRSPGRSDARSAVRPLPASASTRRQRAAVQRDDLDHLRRAAGQRAGLVEGDAADAAGALEVHAAFDQHALAAPRRRAPRRSTPASRSPARTGTRPPAAPARDRPRRARSAPNASGGTTATAAASASTAGV